MTLLVRDEEDIVRYNIDFHLSKGVDFIIATDNGSTDSTRDILREYEARGVLHLIDELTHNHNQAEWNNRMAEIARAQYGADIIFHCDADEFWYPRSGNLKDEILKAQEDILVVDVVNVLLQDKGGEETFPKDTKFAVVNPIIAKDYQEETKHKNLFYFKYPPKVVFKPIKKLLFVAQGNHFVTNKDERITEGKAHDILIYHYPIRSRERFFKKVIRSGSAYANNKIFDEGIGFHLRRWYAQYQAGLLDDEYKKLVLNVEEADKLTRVGVIEEMDFQKVILDKSNDDNAWRFFNHKFEYEETFPDFGCSWAGHKYFGYDLVRNVMPKIIVELGTYKGTSFFSFCQAVKDAYYDARLYAVDTWRGDEHAGFYDDSIFQEISEIAKKYYSGLKFNLLRKNFDDAADEFENSTIDLLHIDGLHTYAAVKHDFETWLPKVNKEGIILLHDIFIDRDDFGVYKFWDELKADYRTIEFHHSYGLGVLFKDKSRYQTLIDRERELQIRYSYIVEDKKNSIINQSLQSFTNQEEQIKVLHSSTSWRVTKPLRDMKQRFRRLQLVWKQSQSAVQRPGSLISTIKKVIKLYRRENWDGIKRVFSDASRHDYINWISLYDNITDDLRVRMKNSMASFTAKPLISVIMPVYNTNPQWLVESIESVLKQIYPWWELCIADDASTDKEIRSILERYAGNDKRIKVVFREQNGPISAASNSALELANGDWIALLDHDDLLSEHALFWVADAISRKHDVCLIYSDEDRIDEFSRRHNPYFKCNWNEDLFYSQNMISHLGVYRTDLVRAIGGFRNGFEGSQDYDFALRYREEIKAQQIHHIPRVLYHWREHDKSTAKDIQSKPHTIQTGEKALNEHFQRHRVKAKAEFSGSGYRVHYELPDKLPLVSLIICTRNALPLLQCCISSILKQTTYSHYEILIIDNGSDDPATLQYLKDVQSDARVRVIRDERPFNYSALNNAAVKLARGEIVGLLNNDLEVISGDWLTEMVSHALRPGIGAVGARLLYPNGTLQHGGIILGLGSSTVAGHVHGSIFKKHHGYFNRFDVIQNFSAVTAACLVIQKNIYEEMGGFNELNLSVAYNDVDFCLRLGNAGYRNIWTPYAVLYHYESATRGKDDNHEKQLRYAKEIRYMKDFWGDTLLTDPCYNPNLSLDYADFSLAWPPRIPLDDF